MKVGIVIWNAFMFKHFFPIYKHMDQAEFLILSRGKDREDINSIRKHMKNKGIVYRDVDEARFYKLDKHFDLYLSTFFPLSHEPIKKPFCIMQYGLAKDLNQFDYRWANSDIRLVYGEHSSNKIDVSRNVFMVGNPRFDDLHNKQLDVSVKNYLQEKIDPTKKTVLYIPTWGDLSSVEIFEKIARSISKKYNLIFLPHHLLNQKDPIVEKIIRNSISIGSEFEQHIDVLPYAFEIADCAISDSSGVIFDALYCDVPVILFRRSENAINRKKQTVISLEFQIKTKIFDEKSELKSILTGIESEIESRNSLKYFNKNNFFSRSGDCGEEAVRCINIGFNDLVRNGRCPMVMSIRSMHSFRARSLAMNSVKKTLNLFRKLKMFYSSLKMLPTRIMRLILRLSLAFHNPKLGAMFYANMQFSRSLFYQNKLIALVGRIALRSGDPSIFEKLIKNMNGYKLTKKEKLLLFDYASNLGFDISKIDYFNSRSKLSGIEHNLGKLNHLSDDELRLFEGETGINWSNRPNLVKYYDEAFINTFESNHISREDVISDEIGFFLPRNLLISSSSQSAKFNKNLQVEFLENAINSLLELGYTIKFYLQGAWRLDPSYLVHYPKTASTYISWHTIGDRQKLNNSHCLKSICVKYGSVAGFFSVDDKGYAGFAQALGEKPDALPIVDSNNIKIEDYRSWITENGITKYKGVSNRPVSLESRYLLFCLQVPDDSVSELSNIASFEALDACIKFCGENDLICMVRPHPKTHRYYQRKYKKYKHMKNVEFDNNVDLHQQIIASEFVVTCNSGTGAEALLLGVPVVTFGKSDYGLMCREATNLTQFSDFLSECLNEGKDCVREDIDKLMQNYLSAYHVPYDDQMITKKRFQILLEGEKS